MATGKRVKVLPTPFKIELTSEVYRSYLEKTWIPDELGNGDKSITQALTKVETIGDKISIKFGPMKQLVYYQTKSRLVDLSNKSEKVAVSKKKPGAPKKKEKVILTRFLIDIGGISSHVYLTGTVPTNKKLYSLLLEITPVGK